MADTDHTLEDVGWSTTGYITHKALSVQITMGEYGTDVPICPVCGYEPTQERSDPREID